MDQLNRKLPANLGQKGSGTTLHHSSSAMSLVDVGGNSGTGGRPALEFAKAICRVLELDETVKEEVLLE